MARMGRHLLSAPIRAIRGSFSFFFPETERPAVRNLTSGGRPGRLLRAACHSFSLRAGVQSRPNEVINTLRYAHQRLPTP